MTTTGTPAPTWRLLFAAAAFAALSIAAVGCRQYDVQGSSIRENPKQDPFEAAARLRVKPGVRSGVSEQSQDIERSLGY